MLVLYTHLIEVLVNVKSNGAEKLKLELSSDVVDNVDTAMLPLPFLLTLRSR
jgi:hypothetical protein